jgi:hypothetical protein
MRYEDEKNNQFVSYRVIGDVDDCDERTGEAVSVAEQALQTDCDGDRNGHSNGTSTGRHSNEDTGICLFGAGLRDTGEMISACRAADRNTD